MLFIRTSLRFKLSVFTLNGANGKLLAPDPAREPSVGISALMPTVKAYSA
jgi:hypothetical protein